MIAKNLEAPLTEAEERPIDRALMAGTWQLTCLTYRELADHYKTVAESLQRRLDDTQNDNIVLRRKLQEKSEFLDRLLKGARNED
jgi:acyl-CoA synthetase (AMP-forming)/AMP-acid ligase II